MKIYNCEIHKFKKGEYLCQNIIKAELLFDNIEQAKKRLTQFVDLEIARDTNKELESVVGLIDKEMIICK